MEGITNLFYRTPVSIISGSAPVLNSPTGWGSMRRRGGQNTASRRGGAARGSILPAPVTYSVLGRCLVRSGKLARTRWNDPGVRAAGAFSHFRTAKKLLLLMVICNQPPIVGSPPCGKLGENGMEQERSISFFFLLRSTAYNFSRCWKDGV